MFSRPRIPGAKPPRFQGFLRGIRRLWSSLKNTEVFVGSFALLIVLGTIGLKVLPGIYKEAPLGWTDAAFTATSAVCVTGLIVVDTATYFTFQGQLFLLLLIQLGGIGMMSLATLVIMALGGRPSLRSEAAATVINPGLSEITPRKLVLAVIRFTFAFESIGALLLYILWVPKMGWREAIWPAIFHSVSAFCNAGFSTYSDSLVQFSESPATLLVISCLIISGGLGFVVMEELIRYFQKPKHKRRTLSLHTKLVLWSTMLLIFVGASLFLLFEWNEGLNKLSVTDRIVNALFLSITPRTAGFNTVDYASMTTSTNFLTILLMTVGGAPGSTAGGFKVTSLAILVLLASSRLRARQSVTFAERSIPDETVQRAVGLLVVGGGIIVFGIFLLAGIGDLFGQHELFLVEAFEVVSAFNTVGLSMGATSHLSVQACWVVIFLMFIGRVGPLSLAAVLQVRFAQRGTFRYAHEDVIVG
ncbi:TrkH family potassium uptake protein [Aeoliella mucimassa]|uniref:Ktr system potassium uptake protein B n=1 Tax=Aeoliella mucimassa TaxID=2527972 RepID=A0A518ASQ0_9BACT|nr:TrkH family potassium uptake protein [Aeoliella mucimassa]QDU57762.1 Ktr system potassium uptake protein B [Aeoliella mucimassa]